MHNSEKLKKAADKVDHWIDLLDDASGCFERVTGAVALRRYHWLLNRHTLNKAKNWRGIVIDAKWKSAYEISGKVGDALLIGNFVVNLYKRAHDVKSIWESADDPATKSSKLLSLTSATLLKSLAGDTAAAGLHVLLQAERVGKFVAGKDISHPTQLDNTLYEIDVRRNVVLDSALQTITSRDITTGFKNTYTFVRLHLRKG
jgi:predicted metal-dependent hydrolase